MVISTMKQVKVTDTVGNMNVLLVGLEFKINFQYKKDDFILNFNLEIS